MSNCRLILGDCLEILPTLEGVDAVITDPPYGVELGVATDLRGKKHGLGKSSYSSYGDTYEDFVGTIVPRLNMAIECADRAAVFCGPNFQEQRKASAIGGIYCPCATGRHQWGFNTFLPILFYGICQNLNQGSKKTVLKSTARSEENGHPCPKPLEWMLWLVELASEPGDTVLDPFMGSGTTGVACERLGRNFIGIEIDETYFKIAEKRIAAEKARYPLFEGTPHETQR